MEKNMNRVFVLGSTKNPLMPCHPARARELLNRGRAAVYRMEPFTIILKGREGGGLQGVELKIDTGSKATGLALVAETQRGRVVVWAANLSHRGLSVKMGLAGRKSLRCGRRGRKTRHRKARWKNRTREANCGGKWLAPSLKSRVDNVKVWLGRLAGFAPLSEIQVETVRFDTQKLVNPEIEGVEYQRGTLFEYEAKEYLLEKWGRKCAYCGVGNVPLQREHIVPRASGGSNKISNLAIACAPCNAAKNALPIEVFLAGKPGLLKAIQAQAKKPLRDAAAVNSTRKALGSEVMASGLKTSFWTGGRTKFNRVNQGYAKDHWVDAACVGETGAAVHIRPGFKPLLIRATGRGSHQTVRADKFGFPAGKAGRCKRVHGFQTGDLVRLELEKGKHAGIHTGRLSGVRMTRILDIKPAGGKAISANYKHFKLLQRADGYDYSHK